MASKKASTKPPKSRPASTSALSQPDVTSAEPTAATFSDDGRYLAILSLAVDKHRLRVYDSASAQNVSEYTVDSARATTLAWARFSASLSQKPSVDLQRKSKRKRKSDAVQSAPEASSSEPVIVLGLSDGSVILFSPAHGRVIRTLTHPTSTSAIRALDSSTDTLGALSIWSVGSDGILRVWDAQIGAHRGAYKTDDRIPCTAIRIRPGMPDAEADKQHAQILAAHYRIQLLSTSADFTKAKSAVSFTGHASTVTALHWQPTIGTPSRNFLSIAKADRHVCLWSTPDAVPGEGSLVASLALDADARAVAYTASHILALSVSGRIAVFDGHLPSKKAKVAVAPPRTTIVPPNKGHTAPVVAAAFAEGGKIRIARLLGGVKPIIDVVPFLNASEEYIPDISLPEINAVALSAASAAPVAPIKRLGETSGLVVQSSFTPGQDAEMDDIRDLDGVLDADLAELSLGQRLTVLEPPVSTRKAHVDSDSGVEDGASEEEEATPITLTRTLIQALHSSDARLLETCFTHTHAPLIMQTVRRLPPQLAVPLLTACVERLSRGARGATAKGRGGAAGTQRAAGLIHWVKAVLVVHSGHLLTIPDLIARLASLHATLAARASLQGSLRALSGRLDLVLQQMELRAVPAPAPLRKGPARGKERERATRRYVEGESEDEDEDEEADVVVEEGSDTGSVEDVELGVESDEDESGEDEPSDEDDEGDEDDEDEDDLDRLTSNGFIDDEAEESDDDGSD